jgi:hypothetical protein
MKQKETLIIASGQAGVRLGEIFKNKHKYADNILFFNTNKDDDVKDVNLLDTGEGADGSGRDPGIVIKTIIPKNESMIKDKVTDALKAEKGVKTVVLLNSIGGGSGSAINYHIIKNILIPFKGKDRNIDIISIMVLPFKSSGNPNNSNAAFMINQYYKFIDKISIIPVENDKIYKAPTQGNNTFDDTNENICSILSKIVNYEYFLGKTKDGGLNTLDRNEHSRIFSPSDGFLCYSKVKLNAISDVESVLNNFNIMTCKKLIVMFRTPDGTAADLNLINDLDSIFSNQVKIFVESSLDKDEEPYIEILANGVLLPDYFESNLDTILTRVEKLTEKKESDKGKNSKNLSRAKNKNLLGL